MFSNIFLDCNFLNKSMLKSNIFFHHFNENWWEIKKINLRFCWTNMPRKKLGIEWSLKNFSTILHSQFNYNTLPVTTLPCQKIVPYQSLSFKLSIWFPIFKELNAWFTILRKCKLWQENCLFKKTVSLRKLYF